MSWDIYLTIDTGGEYPRTVIEVGNYTFNVSPMYYEVFDLGLRDTLDGELATDCIEDIESALVKLQADPEHFKAMNPKNGWGDYEGAVKFLEDILVACKENPRCTVQVC